MAVQTAGQLHTPILAHPPRHPHPTPPSTRATQVDGPLSVYCYLHTLDLLLARYRAKWEKRHGRAFRLDDAGGWVGGWSGPSGRLWAIHAAAAGCWAVGCWAAVPAVRQQ